ncbi:deoxyribodipyrimidine photo-lyase [Reinekea marina]|uniref:Cryptochrome/photolyase family protein n=1 Tax=Reinekea marina TaxID=1310421 RepID=A0ABV7WNN4_9GAMM|nr:deoxyribodipyrimidine photo-lyase [Reinekea marina]MDN3650748.1 deoxyribodipyrimidine photo-lyase [Reinekea marina]
MQPSVTLMWFEQDLRLSDNPALSAALAQVNVLPIFILDEKNCDNLKLGGASRVWLYESLSQLNTQLNGALNLYLGDAETIIENISQRFNITNVFWNRRYEPWRISRDTKIKKKCSDLGIHAKSFNGTLLNEPWTILKADRTPYKVFSPYHRQCIKKGLKLNAVSAPKVPSSLVRDAQSTSLDCLPLQPSQPWGASLLSHWQPCEQGAHSILRSFLENGLEGYQENRDFPAVQSVSRLSPHLHFGEVSPRQICQELSAMPESQSKEGFMRELYWREFSYYLLFHWPSLPSQNFQPSFDHFPWLNKADQIGRWQKGLTGFPIIDAGMRELWQTGYMHNRVRMITASFLVKNLMVDWRIGAKWFWDCLVDADLANNSASWQWVAGCGTDAAPYFRIFNPVTQSEKFDPKGLYIKQYLPELKALPIKYLFRPWEAPEDVLAMAQVSLGDTYPKPMVDLKASRERALLAYKNIS